MPLPHTTPKNIVKLKTHATSKSATKDCEEAKFNYFYPADNMHT